MSALSFRWCICGNWGRHLSVRDASPLPLWPPSVEGSSLSEEPDALELGRSFAGISLQSEATGGVCKRAFSSRVSPHLSGPLPRQRPRLLTLHPSSTAPPGPPLPATCDQKWPLPPQTLLQWDLRGLVRAAVTKYHQSSNFNRNLFLRTLGSAIKESAGPRSPEGSGEGLSVPRTPRLAPCLVGPSLAHGSAPPRPTALSVCV